MKALFVFASFILTSTLAIAAPTMQHLTFSAGQLHAHCHWLVGPSSTGESVLKIEWMDGTKHVPTEPPGSFDVAIDMPSMPMENPMPRISHIQDTQGRPVLGAYQVSNLFFSMGGEWQVQVTMKYADGRATETKAITLNLSQAIE